VFCPQLTCFGETCPLDHTRAACYPVHVPECPRTFPITNRFRMPCLSSRRQNPTSGKNGNPCRRESASSGKNGNRRQLPTTTRRTKTAHSGKNGNRWRKRTQKADKTAMARECPRQRCSRLITAMAADVRLRQSERRQGVARGGASDVKERSGRERSGRGRSGLVCGKASPCVWQWDRRLRTR
jgi:hypothetical protein